MNENTVLYLAKEALMTSPDGRWTCIRSKLVGWSNS